MIIGIGTDIVAIPRIATAMARRGEAFAEHVLAPAEWPEFQICRDQPRFVAKRFAVKEAFAKAVGTGMRAPVAFDAIWVEHDALGKPLLRYSPQIAAWLAPRGRLLAHLSLSDEKETVVAFVILESLETPV